MSAAFFSELSQGQCLKAAVLCFWNLDGVWHLKSHSDNPEGTDGSRGCAASGLGVAGTALETDVNFFF